MKRVVLKKMVITHFKGISHQEIDFADSMTICGDNGLGKSTIYNAYLWCLFGKNQDGLTFSVQPKTKDNEIVHKLDNIVELFVEVDGVPVTIKRVNHEDWSTPRGKSEEVFKGNVVERYYNDIPCSVKEFSDKLNAICNVDDWFMLSSINTFMSLKQEDRRKKLIAISEDIDEGAILNKYPSVKKALAEGKTIEEYLRIVKSSIKRLQQEVDEIPARIDQQGKMIQEMDFDKIEGQIGEIQREIEKIDKKIISVKSPQTTDEYVKLQAELRQLQVDANDIVSGLQRDRMQKENEIKRLISLNQMGIKNAQDSISDKNAEITRLEKRNEERKSKVQELSQQWCNTNKLQFEYAGEDACPVCGAAYPEDKKTEMYNNAIKRYNEEKIKKLKALQDEAQSIIADKTRDEKRIEEIKLTQKDLNQCIDNYQAQLKQFEKELAQIPTLDHALLANREYNVIKDKIQALEQQVKSHAINDEKAKSEELVKSLQEERSLKNAEYLRLGAELNQKAINERARKLIADLEKQAKDQAGKISLLQKEEHEIKCYKKETIEMVESNVSKYFTMVSWKMYEPNISNDGEKEICQAIIDGKSYEEQNTATKVNAGVDIISGLSKALGVSMPLFVDNTESVNNLYQADMQMIKLKVTTDKELLFI